MTERRRFWVFTLAALAVYAVSPITEWGDSLHYALMVEQGKRYQLFESAHLLWRPLGWLLWHFARMLNPAARAFEPLRAFTVVASAFGVGVAAVWLRRRFSEPVAAVGTAMFALGYAYWSYASTACSYTPAMSASLASLVLLWPEPGRPASRGRVALAAALQALAVCLWIPLVLNTPAICVAAALRREGDGRVRWNLGPGIRYGLLAALLTLAVFCLCWIGVVRGHLPTVQDWLSSGQHGASPELTRINVARGGYGWTRLFWQAYHVGVDRTLPEGWGRVLNRHVLWDWGMWKIPVAYLLAGLAFIAGLLRLPRKDWPTALILAVAILPHACFALTFKGGDPERWVPAWGPFLCGVLAWSLGPQPSQRRQAILLAALLLVIGVGAADRFSPRGNVYNRPQMRMISEARPHVHPGDLVYLGGEEDESQLNRTIQSVWGVQWVYFTGAGAIDVWTWPLDTLGWGEMRYSPTRGQSGRGYVAESVLGGIPEEAPHVDWAEANRRKVMLRLPGGQLRPAFTAGGEQFYELTPVAPVGEATK